MTTNLSASSDERLDEAVAGVRARTIPEFPNPVVAFPNDTVRSALKGISRSPRSSRRRWLAALGAGTLVAAVMIAGIAMMNWPKDAWAQVAQAVQNQNWVRFRMKAPVIPSTDPVPEVEMWISIKRQVAAARYPGGAGFSNLESQERRRYDEKQQTIFLSDTSSFDEGEFFNLASVLKSLQANTELHQPEESRAKLLSQSRRMAKDGDRTWTEFVFHYEDSRRSPPQYSRIFRVPQGATLPDRMTDEFDHEGKTISRVMDMDYPDTGPVDLFALNVPRDTKVIGAVTPSDLKQTLDAYSVQQRTEVGAYSALMLKTVTKPDWKWVNDIHKLRHDTSEYVIEVVALESLLDLSMRIHEGTLPFPDQEADRLAWWKEKSAELKFTPFQGGIDSPDLEGYPSLGIPNEGVHATLNPQASVGPSKTVLLDIIDSKTNQLRNRHWLDPQRGLLCVRAEHHPASGYLDLAKPKGDWIAVTIVDTAEKSPTGRWCVTQVRRGIVKQSGDDLQTGMIEGAPYATTTTRYLVEFSK
jgi:hypothetical protein